MLFLLLSAVILKNSRIKVNSPPPRAGFALGRLRVAGPGPRVRAPPAGDSGEPLPGRKLLAEPSLPSLGPVSFIKHLGERLSMKRPDYNLI